MSLEVLRDQIIRSDAEIEKWRKEGVSEFPSRDGYYWLRWPKGRINEATGEPHAEPCEVKDGGLFLIHTQFDQREYHEHGFTFAPLYFQSDIDTLRQHLQHALWCPNTPDYCEDCQKADELIRGKD